ncbi:MAG: hypothetical protein RLZ44_1563 [Pseudomonadota bacterium]
MAAIEALKTDDKASKALQADGLYGYALALQSLAYWRMEKWDEAVATSREALAAGGLGERDLALMRALPGLIKNDQGFARLKADRTVLTCQTAGQPPSFGQWQLQHSGTPMNLHCAPQGLAVRDQLAGALCDIDAGRSGAPEGHPVRRYLALSQLATIANVRDMCDNAQLDGAAIGGAPPKFYSACVAASVGSANCVANQYQGSMDVLVEAIVKDFCGGWPLARSGVTWDLVKKSGIDPNRLRRVCAEP